MMDKQRSAKFERFEKSFFTGPCYRDGPDLEVLDLLDEAELAEAERLLIESLTQDDIYSIQALGYIRSRPALPRLLNLLSQATSTAKVYIAEALWRIDRYEPAVPILCEILTKRGFFLFRDNHARWEAAMALKEVDDERAVKALKIGLKDKDILVHSHSRESLAVLLGVKEEFERLEKTIFSGDLYESQKARRERDQLVEKALADYDRRQSGQVDRTG